MAGSQWQDSGQAPEALAQVLAEHGPAGLSNAQVMAGMLKDLMPNAPRETNVLVQAAEVGLAQTLQERLDQGLAPDAAVAMAARTLQEQTGLGQDASLWAAATIGTAMGLLPGSGGQQGRTAELPDPAGVPAPGGRPDDQTVYGQVPQNAPADTRTTFAQPGYQPGQYQQAQYPQAQQAGFAAGQQAGYAAGQQAQYQQPPQYQQPQYQAPQPGYQPGQGYGGGYQAGQAGYPAGQPVSPYPAGTLPPGGSRSRGKTGTIIGVAAAAVVLLIGLVVWAPWSGSSVQSPTNLHTAAAATANTVTLAWSAPSGGPAPSKYEIVENGRLLHGFATGTTERIVDLSPATSYRYQIIAVSGGKTSQPSASLITTTLTPPLSAARLQNSYTTSFQVIKADPKDWLFKYVGKRWTNTWRFTPDCSAGACKDIGLTGSIMKFSFSTTLSWDGKLYYGTAAPVLGYCANNTAYPIHYQLRIGVKVTSAAPSGTDWAATKWTGVILGVLPYTPAGSTFCARHAFESGLKGSSS